MNFDVACNMNFANYPFDKQVNESLKNITRNIFHTQTCDINVMSFTLAKNKLLMQWYV